MMLIVNSIVKKFFSRKPGYIFVGVSNKIYTFLINMQERHFDEILNVDQYIYLLRIHFLTSKI